MKAKTLLKIAAILMLLHTVGHTIGALTWKNAPNAAIAQVVAGMLHNRFQFMGHSVSIGDFYAGYGYTMIAVLFLLTILLWLLARNPNPAIILAIGLFFISLAIIEYVYFFAFPALISSLAAISTLAAYWKLRLYGDTVVQHPGVVT